MAVVDLRDRKAAKREMLSLGAYRRVKGVSLAELSERCRRDQATLSYILRGIAPLKGTMLSELRRIRAAIDELVTERGRI